MPHQKFNSRYLQLRLYEDELEISCTSEAGKFLQQFLVSATNEGTKWKHSPEYILGALCEGMADEDISMLDSWIDMQDKQLVKMLLDKLYWDGESSITRNNHNQDKRLS